MADGCAHGLADRRADRVADGCAHSLADGRANGLAHGCPDCLAHPTAVANRASLADPTALASV